MPQWLVRRRPIILQTQPTPTSDFQVVAATIEVMLRVVSSPYDREKLSGIFLGPEGHGGLPLPVRRKYFSLNL